MIEYVPSTGPKFPVFLRQNQINRYCWTALAVQSLTAPGWFGLRRPLSRWHRGVKSRRHQTALRVQARRRSRRQTAAMSHAASQKPLRATAWPGKSASSIPKVTQRARQTPPHRERRKSWATFPNTHRLS